MFRVVCSEFWDAGKPVLTSLRHFVVLNLTRHGPANRLSQDSIPRS